MSFKFNFGADEKEDAVQPASVVSAEASKSDVTQSDEIKPFTDVEAKLLKPLESYAAEAFPLDDACTIFYISEKTVESDLKENPSEGISSALEKNSDLVPNVYEGGLKIWECSLDLLDYFSEKEIAFEGKHVLELGCGAALPSLYALKRGAKAVDFSDYNDAVLQNVTVPNVHLNCEEDNHSDWLERCHFFAGDWACLQEELTSRGNKYDVIITSETIYSEASYEKLHDVMAALLRDDGIVYLAAKTYYFGVGGSLQSFQALLEKRNVFEFEVCKHYGDDGVPREILSLKKKTTT